MPTGVEKQQQPRLSKVQNSDRQQHESAAVEANHAQAEPLENNVAAPSAELASYTGDASTETISAPAITDGRSATEGYYSPLS